MYKIREENNIDLKNLKTKYYQDKTGLSLSYLSSILNGNRSCIETNARAILSVRFDISFTNEKMQELLEKYFEEE